MKALMITGVATFLLLFGSGLARAIEGEMVVHHDGTTTSIPMAEIVRMSWNAASSGVEIEAEQTYVYPLSSLEKITFENLADVPEDSPGQPRRFTLGQAYPNPFNAAVTIPLSLVAGGEVDVRVVNVLGQRLLHKTVALAAGEQRLVLDARGGELAACASGLYLLQVRSRGQMSTQKLMLLK